MHVVATAGHVDHGKSTLVDALTGMHSDRLAEEQRRGLSIELGYVWTSLGPDVPASARVAEGTAGREHIVAFVDVPGHERFVPTMLAGVGPVPAALLVVAADDPWMPQAAEHLAALDALGVAHGVVAVTRSDLADPGPMVARATDEVARTSLAGASVVPVSAVTGQGLEELRSALRAMLDRLPAPDPGADVRLWVDRRFTVRGAGTVVTGTLPAGTVARGDRLTVSGPEGGGVVRVRGVQSLGADVEAATGVARVALNLTGEGAEALDRGTVLTTPGAYAGCGVVDVRLEGRERAGTGREASVPASPLLHVGAASVPVRARPLGDGLARLSLAWRVPLRVGDRALLRDPGSRAVWGVRVLDPDPPALRRRGAAAARAAVLARLSGDPDLGSELERRGMVAREALRRLGVPDAPVPPGTVEAGGWLVGSARAEHLAGRVAASVRDHHRGAPLAEGLSLTALADRLGVPSAEVVAAVVRPPLRVAGGRVVPPGEPGLPPEVERAASALAADLADAPFAAPTAGRLAELGLDARRQAAAARAGRLLRVAPGIVLLAGADRQAVARLAELPQPFTTSEARQALGTSRRVALPLLEHLDKAGLTRRLPDDRRTVVQR